MRFEIEGEVGVVMMIDEDMEMLKHFRERLSIDSFELEKECCEQAIVYDDVGIWVAEVKARAKTAKEHVSFVESDLSSKIRKDPKSYDLPEKPTVGAVISAVKINPEYLQAFKDYVEADKLANESSTLLESVGQRKSGIRDLVRLYIHNYYQREDKISSEQWQQDEKAIVAMRNRRATEEENLTEDNVVEEE